MHNPAEQSGQAFVGDEFLSLALPWFDPAFYLRTYPDVWRAQVDPLQHWLNYGAREGRQISRRVVFRYGKDARNSTDRNWRCFHWRGLDIAARLISPIPALVTEQILNQAHHEPSLPAATDYTISDLEVLDRENVHLDVARLQRTIATGVEFVLLIPTWDLAAEGFVAGLLKGLNAASFQSICAIVTSQESANCQGPIKTESIGLSSVLFWRDFWIEGPLALKLLQMAQLIRALRPRIAIVADGYGAETVACFGRALSRRTKMYCVCADDFVDSDLSIDVLNAFPFAMALTDSPEFADRLRKYHGSALGQGIATLPRYPSPAFAEAVATLFRRS